METFGSWKTMNKQMKFPAKAMRLAVAAVMLAAGAAAVKGQGGADRIPVTLSDPSRPAHVKVSMVNGGITVKASEGKEVVVEARVRNRDNARNEGGPKRIAISSTGLSVEEENNEVNINT